MSEASFRREEMCSVHLSHAQKWSTGLTILSIDELRRVFNVEDKYPRFAELKRRVIEAAVKEVNLNSPKHIEVEYQKRGRKITHVKFFCLNSKS